MKNFWPQRSEANGFSIQNLAREYRLKISTSPSNEVSNKRLVNKNSKSIKKITNNISIVYQSVKTTHWANRDFSEYKKAA